MPQSKLAIIIDGMAGVAFIGLNLVLNPFLRGWRMHWGATPEEIARPMPGDELAPRTQFIATRAITIHAPAECVWPWLVQIGCHRAGWYSYDLLDNGGAPSADRILPEFQALKVGDALPMMASGPMAMPVRALDPGRALAVGGTINTATGKDGDIHDRHLKQFFSWVILMELVPQDARTTRLVIRNRAGWNPSFSTNLMNGLMIEAISFCMERKMLLGIKARAERNC